MRMLKSGLNLVLDIDWIYDEDTQNDLEDIIINHDVYGAHKFYQGAEDPYNPTEDDDYYLAAIDVKLPLNHRYLLTYFNNNSEAAATVHFDTFGIEEEYKKPNYSEDAGYNVLFLWLYNEDDDVVGGTDYPIYISSSGITFNSTINGNFKIRVYQLD